MIGPKLLSPPKKWRMSAQKRWKVIEWNINLCAFSTCLHYSLLAVCLHDLGFVEFFLLFGCGVLTDIHSWMSSLLMQCGGIMTCNLIESNTTTSTADNTPVCAIGTIRLKIGSATWNVRSMTTITGRHWSCIFWFYCWFLFTHEIWYFIFAHSIFALLFRYWISLFPCYGFWNFSFIS